MLWSVQCKLYKVQFLTKFPALPVALYLVRLSFSDGVKKQKEGAVNKSYFDPVLLAGIATRR